MHERFWTQPRLRELNRYLTLVMLGRNGISPERAQDEMRAAGVRVMPARTVRDFLANPEKNQRHTEALGPLLLWTLNEVETRRPTRVLASALHAAAVSLAADWHRESRPAENDAYNGAPLDMKSLIAAVSLLLNIHQPDTARLIAGLFEGSGFTTYVADKGRSERYYLCYRYHSGGAQVVKSHLRIMGPNAEVPGVCRFVNTVRLNQGRTTEASGVLLPMSRATYLFGVVDGGAGLTLAAVPGLGGDHSHGGLFLSFDEDNVQIAGRIALTPTPIAEPAEAGIGTFPVGELEAELAPIKPLIKNTVPFTLEEAVYFAGREVDQARMVHLVAEALTGPDGAPLLRYADGRPFNPADTRHYTFNAALRIWQSTEAAQTPVSGAKPPLQPAATDK